jgi:hypothetical protein
MREPVSISTLVWLKLSHDANSVGGNIFGDPAKISLGSTLGVIRVTDWEARSREWRINGEQGQLPRQVIEGRSQANEISSQQTDSVGDVAPNSYLDNVLSTFRIVMLRDSIRLTLLKSGDFFAESVEMFLRPSHFNFRVNNCGHNGVTTSEPDRLLQYQ